MLSADGQPIQVGFDVPQLAVVRGPAVIGKGVGGLENTDTVVLCVGHHIIFFERAEGHSICLCNLVHFIHRQRHENRF